MPFDPSLPSDHGPLSSATNRAQLNALKALIDAQAAQIAALTARVAALESGKPSMDDVNAAITANAAANPTDITYLQLQVSDPPTQSDVQSVLDLQNSLITALKRM